MSKRGENIYKRKDGRWEGRYIKGRNTNGSIHYGYVYGQSYKFVKEKLTIKKATVFSESQTSRFYGTLNNWLDYWLDNVAYESVKPSTLNSYRSKIDCHIRPMIGELFLSDLSSEHLNRFIQTIERKLSVNSLHAVFRVLKTSLKYAERLNFIHKAVYENVSLPKLRKKKIDTISQFEHKLLIKESKKSYENLPVFISLKTGLRIGEISGLKWSDLDFNNRTMTVRRTLQRVGVTSNQMYKTQIIEEKPKSDMSERTIPLSADLCQLLLKYKKTSSSEYVVSQGEKWIEPRTVRYQFQRLLKKLNLSSYSFHSLRHSFATRCMEKGISIAVISSLLGHASTKMTLDIYISSNLEEERQAMEAIASL